jgi:hypothetical protein
MMSGLLMRRGRISIWVMNEPLRVRYLPVPGNLHHQETLHTDRNTLRGRVTQMYRPSQDISASKESIEAIILDSATEQTRQYILRRIRDAQEQKPTEGRLDRIHSLLLACFMVRRLSVR